MRGRQLVTMSGSGSGSSVNPGLPILLPKSIGDKLYEKRKAAALEIEQLVKRLSAAGDDARITVRTAVYCYILLCIVPMCTAVYYYALLCYAAYCALLYAVYTRFIFCVLLRTALCCTALR